MLEDQAFRLKQSGKDAKWRELLSILDERACRDGPTSRPAAAPKGACSKSRSPRDTREYLQQKIALRRLAETGEVPAGARLTAR